MSSPSSSSETPKTQESKPLDQPNSQEKTQQNQEEEEEGECPFCAYMKAGACRETFVEWEKCVEEGEKYKEDIVDKCFEVTDLLKKCMEANPDHYGPILEAQNAAEKITVDELEKEKEIELREKEEAVPAAAAANQEKQS